METAPGVTVYWRPGCGFCSSLFRQLERQGVPHERVNIWEDETGAATVRAAANGNETVPTVDVGGVMLVNPDVHQLLAVAAEHAPDAVPAGYVAPEPSRFGRWLSSKLDPSG